MSSELDDNKKDSEKQARRTVKDTVFRSIFSIRKYLLQMYQSLHPEDVLTVESDLDVVTLDSILVNDIYNDLGFNVGDKLIILVEAQSTWTYNIVVRALLYLATTYQRHFEKTHSDMYSSKKLVLPRPELYVVYTGEKGNYPDVISLNEEYFNGQCGDVEVKVKVIFLKDESDNDIISQYIMFCRIISAQFKEHGYSEQAVKNAINICIKNNILSDYLKDKHSEVESIMSTLYSQDTAIDNLIYNSKKEGREEGRQEEKINIAKILLQQGAISIEKLKNIGVYTEEELAALAAQ